ncbi:MAG: PilZ domain-containing protein [Syntrophobacteraceae bacterium]|jgi:c-di-GMP-binding flagellar brake protein YcgR
MKFDDLAEKMACTWRQREAGKKDPDADAEVPAPIKIPLRIDDGIIARSLTNPAHIARSRIIGAMYGEFILITEPTVKINDRVSAVLDEGFLCSYFSDGRLYIFNSRYRRRLIDDIICIEYPREVEVRQMRRHRRIRVNIETKVVVADTADSSFADMVDISHGGCRLVLNERVPMRNGTALFLTFSLPNEALISELRAVVVRMAHTENDKATEVGLSFAGPESELSKIANFCEFCMFFDLE